MKDLVPIDHLFPPHVSIQFIYEAYRSVMVRNSPFVGRDFKLNQTLH